MDNPTPTIYLSGTLKDLPFHQLFEKDVEQMTEAELRELAQELRERAGSGTARAAANKRQAKVIAGKAKIVSMEDVL